MNAAFIAKPLQKCCFEAFNNYNHTAEHSLELWLHFSVAQLQHSDESEKECNREITTTSDTKHLLLYLYKKSFPCWWFATGEIKWRKRNATNILWVTVLCTAFHAFHWLDCFSLWHGIFSTGLTAEVRIFSKQFIRMLCLDCTKKSMYYSIFLSVHSNTRPQCSFSR